MSTGRGSTLVRAGDLFCGAGGFSSGLMAAAGELGLDLELVAVNHWQIAIETHSRNHPKVRHYCQDLDAADPRKLVPEGRLELLLGAPECTHFSSARGGKPMSDQSRSSAWCILRWLEALDVRCVLLENVREFADWGPLYPADHPEEKLRNRPIPEKKGKLFRLFLHNLRQLGYSVDYRVLNAADYGDATTRQRLFIQARKGRKRITWPEPTHLKPGEDSLGLYPDAPRWRPAREIIDWSIQGESIFRRRKPLAPNTIARILAGLQKFCGLPFVLGQQSGAQPRGVDQPIPTVAGAGAISLTEPFLVILQNNRDAASVDAPLPTVLTSGAHFGLCESFVFPLNHGKNDLRSHSLDAPMPTITSVDAWGLAEPYLIEYHGERAGQDPRCRSVDGPLTTVGTANFPGLVQPFLVKFNGTAETCSLDEPLDTISTRDRFALVDPKLYDESCGEIVGYLDIRFRMLQPSELAAAMSFPKGYEFAGSREQRVRQIGNAVPCRLAAALCREILGRALAQKGATR